MQFADAVSPESPAQSAMARPGTLYIAAATLAVLITQGTAQQFQTCHDAVNCGGNEVTGVSTAEECCLGDGFSFTISGQCVQCIVHGFERTVVLVDEGNVQETLVISLDIKGTTADELAQNQVNQFDLTVLCQDVTTERARDDYSSTACGSRVELDLNDPGALTSEVLISFPADSVALEGTEELRLELQLSPATQAAVDFAGNVFFQDTSIQIRDTTVLRSGYQEEDYSGNEGPDRNSPLPNMPCTVTIRLQQTSIETNLTFRLTPRTVPENVAANGPPPTGSLRGTNASSADFDNTTIEVTMVAGTEAVTTSIPIIDDSINEPEQDFLVVLEVASSTTNPLMFTIQTVVCRIPESDPVDIGFRRERIEHNETTMQFVAVLEKDRPSEQTFVIRVQISTPQIQGVGEPATEGSVPPADFRIGVLTVITRLTPDVNFIEFDYAIFEDNTPENTEIFQLSSDPDPDTPNNPRFDCDESRGCFQDLQVLILDNDVVVIGYVETLVEVDESDGQATLNVSISFPEPNPALGFEIMFGLFVTTMEGSAGQRPAPAGRFDPIIPGIQDYQGIENNIPGFTLPFDFQNSIRSQTFNVEIFEDGVPEAVEELTVSLSLQDPRLAGVVTVSPAMATVRIRDTDRIVVGFERTTYAVNETDGQVELCVIVMVPVDRNIGEVTFALDVQTQDGTAMGSGMDYNSVMTTLATFTTQQPRQCFNVIIIDDTAVEATENFFADLMLTSVSTIDLNRITVDPARATVEILDNDVPPTTTQPPTTQPPTPTTRRVNDTVTGDPLMTVPLNVGNSTRMLLGLGEGEHVSLCYEVHGEADENFNLVSDVCVSVNAHYMRARSGVDINIIDTIGVRAVDSSNQCHNIRADLGGCRAFVDGVEITTPYSMAGISVRRYPNRVRIAVPNCEDHDLVMWIFCLTNEFTYRNLTFQAPMIRFVIARGLSLLETSHGIIGQFWNIPIDVDRYTQSFGGAMRDDAYTITVRYPDQTPRQFVGLIHPLTWELDNRQCLYAGNRQGGAISEVDGPNDPVLEGDYEDYQVDGLFDTDFDYGHFEDNRCP